MDALDLLNFLNVIFVIVLIAVWWGLYDAAHPPPDADQEQFPSLAMSGMLFSGVPPPPRQHRPRSARPRSHPHRQRGWLCGSAGLHQGREAGL